MEGFECGTCGKAFPAGWNARDNHCRATGHRRPAFECDTCPRWFRSPAACTQHMNDKNHFAYECNVCDDTWPTEEDRTLHENEDHWYCADCGRQFNSSNGIKMHLRSRDHVGEQMSCPMCGKPFATATGVTHHLERGACPSAPNIDRIAVYNAIRSKDPNGVISKNLLTWPESSQYEATERSWNGYSYECYFCHREFDKIQSLNQHLNSPVHQQDLYHCPNRACQMDFKTLASVINHLESESCGFMRFGAVQKKMGDLVNSNRLLTF